MYTGVSLAQRGLFLRVQNVLRNFLKPEELSLSKGPSGVGRTLSII